MHPKIVFITTMAGLHVFQKELTQAHTGETIVLDPAQSRHLVKSLRARIGESVAIYNGAGTIFSGTLTHDAGQAASVRVEKVTQIPAAHTRLIWAPALLKGKAIDDILRDVITLGLNRMIPIVAERCEVKLDAERAQSRPERWETSAIEACKQSGNPWLPHIDAPQSFAHMAQAVEAESIRGPVFKFIGSLESDAVKIAQAVQALRAEHGEPAAMVLAIGPEGDFSPKEYAQARQFGFIPVQLPGYVFRAGPAALVGLSLLAGTLA